MKQLVARLLGCLCCLAGTVDAAVSYPVVSAKYATVGGASYNTSMMIAGTITTTNPLPPNMALTDIGPAGSNLVSTWSLFDGVNTYTPANSGPYGATAGSVRVATNAAGRISAFSIKLMSPASTAVLVGQSVNVLTISSLPEGRAEMGAFCTLVLNGACRATMNGAIFGAASSTSVIDVDGDGRPDALTDGLLILRYLFGIRGTSLVQGAVAAGATRKTPAEVEPWLLMFAP
jgi:hypothetical protein